MAFFFGCGLVLQPRATRLIAGMLTIDSISDYLQFVYSALEKHSG